MTREQFITHVEGTQKAFRRFLVALCCGDSALADDIAQESYLKAYLSCDGIKNEDKFKAWIFRIGYTTFINQKRSEKVFTDYDDAQDIQSTYSSDSSFRYQELYSALNTLPGKERTSILLFYMEGYSIKEIAEIVESSQDAVKQHLSRGRNHLRNLLTKSR
ncbi:MAG: RNA polymerase sigma factor [Muribaculaceae bacterium]|nr:RNA polymerase sigma factor [Muribaculaceae bacterium]MDE6631368.1 RNA polymerase sigma factor [Muribaculaceae bacterium]